MRRVANATLLQFDRYDESPDLRIVKRPIRARIFDPGRMCVATMRVFEHCEACLAPCGGGTVTRLMRRVADATLLRFGRYDESPDLRIYCSETPDPSTDIFDHGPM
jgi:hypothetical protein